MPYHFYATARIVLRVVLLSPFLGGATAWAAEIQVRLEGLSGAGPVHAALVPADAGAWPSVPWRQAEAQDERVRFADVPPGRYALQLYQDRNGNGRLDLSPRGRPLEPVGFSGNPSLFKGKPGVADSAFAHGAADSVLHIRLRGGAKPSTQEKPGAGPGQ